MKLLFIAGQIFIWTTSYNSTYPQETSSIKEKAKDMALEDQTQHLLHHMGPVWAQASNITSVVVVFPIGSVGILRSVDHGYWKLTV